MPNFQHSRFLEQNAVNQLLIPRNDALLSEVSVDDSTFSLAKGPFSSYERSVEVTPSPSGSQVTETFTYTIASPFWRLLLGIPIRRFLKRSGGSEEKLWWALTGSNRRHSACKADALPTELSALNVFIVCEVHYRESLTGVKRFSTSF